MLFIKRIVRHASLNLLEAYFKDARGRNLPLIRTTEPLTELRNFRTSHKTAIKCLSNFVTAANTNQYHNIHHFREVFCFAFMLGYHAWRNQRINQQDFGLLLIAALIHDHGHDGKSNTIDGVHIPFRLEKYAFETARPQLERYLSNADISVIQALVLATDVSKGANTQLSPAAMIKAYKDSHYTQDLPPEFNAFAQSPARTELALILQDADIAATTTLSLDYALQQSVLVQKEQKAARSASEALKQFLENIADKDYASDTAKDLFGSQLTQRRKEFNLG